MLDTCSTEGMHSTCHTMMCAEDGLVVLLVVFDDPPIDVDGDAICCGTKIFVEGLFDMRVVLIQQEVADPQGGQVISSDRQSRKAAVIHSHSRTR